MANNQLSITEQLKAPFDEEDLVFDIDPDSIEEEAPGAYVALETVELAIPAAYDRLDEVFGIDGWEMFVDPLVQAESTKGFRCQIRAYFPNSRIITKTGVGVSEKGNINEALKKAFLCSIRLFGVGRYLDVEPERWVPVDSNGVPLTDGGEEEQQSSVEGPEQEMEASPEECEAQPDDLGGFAEPQGCDDPIPFPGQTSRTDADPSDGGTAPKRRRRDLPKPQRVPGYRSNAR